VSIGYHPHEAGNTDDDGLDRLAALTAHRRSWLWGDRLGLLSQLGTRLTQQRVFVRHLEMAAAAGLPVVIHSRDAADDTLRLLDSHGAGLTVVLHCFSLPERLAELIARGYFLSFAGTSLSRTLPLCRLLCARSPWSACSWRRMLPSWRRSRFGSPQLVGPRRAHVRVRGAAARDDGSRAGRVRAGERGESVSAPATWTGRPVCLGHESRRIGDLR